MKDETPPDLSRTVDGDSDMWKPKPQPGSPGQDDGLSAAQAEAFARWRENPTAAQAYARLEATWSSLDPLAALRPATPGRPDPDLVLLPRRRPFLPALTLLAAAAAIAILFVVRPRPAPPAAEADQHAQTAVGEHRTLALTDGSSVELNTDSAVTVAYTPR